MTNDEASVDALNVQLRYEPSSEQGVRQPTMCCRQAYLDEPTLWRLEAENSTGCTSKVLGRSIYCPAPTVFAKFSTAL